LQGAPFPALLEHRSPLLGAINHLATRTTERGRLQSAALDLQPQIPAYLDCPHFTDGGDEAIVLNLRQAPRIGQTFGFRVVPKLAFADLHHARSA
jgi:hypothetical protein